MTIIWGLYLSYLLSRPSVIKILQLFVWCLGKRTMAFFTMLLICCYPERLFFIKLFNLASNIVLFLDGESDGADGIYIILRQFRLYDTTRFIASFYYYYTIIIGFVKCSFSILHFNSG